MKNKLKNIWLILFAVLLFPACEGDNDSQPVIKYIRSTDASAPDSLLVKASMGSVIAIIGEDLQDVISVVFNDQRAKLNPAYVTTTSIVVTIPGSIPEEVSNTITLTTSKGKNMLYDFTVIITPPSLTSVSSEWAKDGSTVTLYGDYFFPKEDGTIEVLFPGNLSGTVVNFDETYIEVTVPDGALQGYISVSNDYGTGRSEFIFRDNTGIFIDGENPAVWNNWSLSDFGTDDGIDGSYVKFEGTTGSWAWPANAIQFYYINPAGESLVTAEDENDAVSNYALKFEAYCHEWHDTPMLIWFDNDGAHDVDGDDAQYHWKPYDNSGVASNYTTDGWITVTLPLSDFKYSKDESETSRSISGFDKLQNLNAMWFGGVSEETTEFGLQLWIDNIRLVKIN